jgi:GNAT superfamily N-acetyltransferase
MNQVNEPLHWRPTTSTDLDAISAIGNRIHAALPERPEVFAEKVQLFPEGCFSLARNATIVGYGFSHPWGLNSVPPLDAFLGKLPAASHCLFVHDVVVLPSARGRDAAGELMSILAGVARQRGLAFLALVSVYGTHPLWARHGFEVVADANLARELASYGSMAQYMRRHLR